MDMTDVYTPTHYKLTVEDFYKLGEIGILNNESRVELIEGELIEMAPIGPPHLRGVNRITKLLVLAAGDQAEISVQNPILLPPYSVPQPDFAVLRRPLAGSEETVPGVLDVFVVIEVSDTSLSYDRNTKARLYAKAGIAELWIINVKGRKVERFRQPGDGGYAEKDVLESGARLAPAALPTMEIEVAALFS